MLKEDLVLLLISKGLKIVTAESLTGGLFASEIVSVNDASKVLEMSFVTYSNEAKINILGVKETTIEKYSVVSKEVACEMALGAKKRSNADVAVSFTGYAGPTGDNVGRVCFGIAYLDNVYTYQMEFGCIGRNEVRNAAINFMFEKLLDILKNN